MMTQLERSKLSVFAMQLTPKQLRERVAFLERLLELLENDVKNCIARNDLISSPMLSEVFMTHERKGIASISRKLIEWMTQDANKIKDALSVYRQIQASGRN